VGRTAPFDTPGNRRRSAFFSNSTIAKPSTPQAMTIIASQMMLDENPKTVEAESTMLGNRIRGVVELANIVE